MYQNLHHLSMQLILFQKVKNLELFTKLLIIYLLNHIYFLLIHQILSRYLHLLLYFHRLVIFWPFFSFSFLNSNHHRRQDLMITLLFLLLYFHELIFDYLFLNRVHFSLNYYVFHHHLMHFIVYFMINYVDFIDFFLLDDHYGFLDCCLNGFHYFEHLLAIKYFIFQLQFNFNYFFYQMEFHHLLQKYLKLRQPMFVSKHLNFTPYYLVQILRLLLYYLVQVLKPLLYYLVRVILLVLF